MLVDVAGRIRKVGLIKRHQSVYIFQVGRASLIWIKGEEEPFFMSINGKEVKDRQVQYEAIRFLREWKRAIKGSDKPFPLVTEKTPEERLNKQPTSSGSRNPNYVSGVPPWMREAKVLTPRYYRKGNRAGELMDYALTRFKNPDDKGYDKVLFSKVLEYRPYCYRCQWRADCGSPCEDPCRRSSEDLAEVI